MNEADTMQVMAFLGAMWPNYHRPTARDEMLATARAWASMLGDFELPVVLAAVRAYAAEDHEWPPPIGVLRSRLVAATDGRPPPDPDMAWGEVMSQLRSVGRRGSPEWSHVAITSTVQSMGWSALCDSTNLVADRAHFLQLYAHASRRARTNATPPPDRALLAGLRGLALESGQLELGS